MEITIIEEKENKLFNRNEVKFYVEYEGEATPKLLDVKSKLVALLNTKKDLIVVDNIQPHYGEPKALGYAKIYATPEDLKYIETEAVIAKNTEVEEPAEEDEE
ncbi:MAG: 30S ribosomal protein S24e [Methanobrevibacter sp.]|uniref:30S ribosomal protein S24e n=1 Tax=Methanobrevibacter sp. TaxID=66852 RepID=UPI0026DF06E1|nr:30S ribosomal protein S24e [Methanobrevibacter sp.]MDO5849152.1 30S ribosomal protein S24e [Methanobrevibacter sp.]